MYTRLSSHRRRAPRSELRRAALPPLPLLHRPNLDRPPPVPLDPLTNPPPHLPLPLARKLAAVGDRAAADRLALLGEEVLDRAGPLGADGLAGWVGGGRGLGEPVQVVGCACGEGGERA